MLHREDGRLSDASPRRVMHQRMLSVMLGACRRHAAVLAIFEGKVRAQTLLGRSNLCGGRGPPGHHRLLAGEQC